MESLSPLVRNPSARRLSLELCQKFVSNILSPARDSSNQLLSAQKNQRRASYAYDSRYVTPGTISPLTPKFGVTFSNIEKGASLTPCSVFSEHQPDPDSPGVFDAEVDASDFHTTPEKEKVRRTSMVTCHVIPPTPQTTKTKSRRTSLSDAPKSTFSSNSDNKENDKANNQKKISVSHKDSHLTALACHLHGIHLKPHETLGRGSFGTAVSATYKGKDVAAKILRSSHGSHIEGELHGLLLPPHPHIVHVYDVLKVPPDYCLVILERMKPGNLLTLINDSEQLLEFSRVVDISRQIAQALSFCHSHGIFHLDVKPQNVLLGYKRGQFKLSDFGNSKTRKEIERKGTIKYTKLDGTIAYKAPELFRGETPTDKCDTYSLGITMWHTLTREPPYMTETEHSVIYKVVAQGLRPESLNPSPTSSSSRSNSPLHKKFVQLYHQCWSENPLSRPAMPELQNELKILCQKLFRRHSKD